MVVVVARAAPNNQASLLLSGWVMASSLSGPFLLARKRDIAFDAYVRSSPNVLGLHCSGWPAPAASLSACVTQARQPYLLTIEGVLEELQCALAQIGAIHSTQALVAAELVVGGLTKLNVEGHFEGAFCRIRNPNVSPLAGPVHQ
jgi:hypothetical protein